MAAAHTRHASVAPSHAAHLLAAITAMQTTAEVAANQSRAPAARWRPKTTAPHNAAATHSASASAVCMWVPDHPHPPVMMAAMQTRTATTTATLIALTAAAAAEEEEEKEETARSSRFKLNNNSTHTSTTVIQ